MANTISTRHRSQNKARLSKVFLLWSILNYESFDTRACIPHQLVCHASALKSSIAYSGIISAIVYAWELKPLIKRLTPLFQGGLDLATYINIEIFRIEGYRVFVNHHGRLLFPLSNPQKPLVPTPPIGGMMMTLIWR